MSKNLVEYFLILICAIFGKGRAQEQTAALLSLLKYRGFTRTLSALSRRQICFPWCPKGTEEFHPSVFRMFLKNPKMSTSVQPGCKTVCVQALIKYPLETTFAFFRALLYLEDGREEHCYEGLSILCQSLLRSFGCDQNRRALGHCVFWSLLGTIPVQQRTSGTEEGQYIANKTKYSFIDSFFYVLEMIYNGVINNGVYCDCLGKCDITQQLSYSQKK